jgi:hypothetical protein
MPNDVIWETIVEGAMKAGRKGAMRLKTLYGLVEKQCAQAGRPLTRTWPATVRRTLPQSAKVASGGKRSGIWGLASPAASPIADGR